MNYDRHGRHIKNVARKERKKGFSSDLNSKELTDFPDLLAIPDRLSGVITQLDESAIDS